MSLKCKLIEQLRCAGHGFLFEIVSPISRQHNYSRSSLMIGQYVRLHVPLDETRNVKSYNDSTH